MAMRRFLWIPVLGAVLAFPPNVWAQQPGARWEGRVFVNVGAGAQTASPSFGFAHSTNLWGEPARAELDIPGEPGVAFDVGGGVRLVQNLGVGVTYSRYSKERTAELSTTIPSPFFFGDSRTIERQIPLTREENAVHFQAIYRIPITNRIQVGVFGGPTYFRCTDDLVSQFALRGLVGPGFDWSLEFRDIIQEAETDSVWGFNGGADVVYLFTRYLGLRGSLRYSRSSHETENAFTSTRDLVNAGVWGGGQPVGTVTMDHGGLNWNGGVTFLF